jgi:hypothetical protein
MVLLSTQEAKRQGFGQISSALSLLEDLQEGARRKKESAELKETVQEQVRRLDSIMSAYRR